MSGQSYIMIAAQKGRGLLPVPSAVTVRGLWALERAGSWEGADGSPTTRSI